MKTKLLLMALLAVLAALTPSPATTLAEETIGAKGELRDSRGWTNATLEFKSSGGPLNGTVLSEVTSMPEGPFEALGPITSRFKGQITGTLVGNRATGVLKGTTTYSELFDPVDESAEIEILFDFAAGTAALRSGDSTDRIRFTFAPVVANAVLRGRVVENDGSSSRPIDGAVVHARFTNGKEATAATSGDGEFEIALPKGADGQVMRPQINSVEIIGAEAKVSNALPWIKPSRVLYPVTISGSVDPSKPAVVEVATGTLVLNVVGIPAAGQAPARPIAVYSSVNGKWLDPKILLVLVAFPGKSGQGEQANRAEIKMVAARGSAEFDRLTFRDSDGKDSGTIDLQAVKAMVKAEFQLPDGSTGRSEAEFMLPAPQPGRKAEYTVMVPDPNNLEAEARTRVERMILAILGKNGADVARQVSQTPVESSSGVRVPLFQPNWFSAGGTIKLPGSLNDCLLEESCRTTFYHEMFHSFQAAALPDSRFEGGEHMPLDPSSPPTAFDEGRAHLFGYLARVDESNANEKARTDAEARSGIRYYVDPRPDWYTTAEVRAAAGKDKRNEGGDIEGVVTRFFMDYYGSNVEKNPASVIRDIYDASIFYQDGAGGGKLPHTIQEFIAAKKDAARRGGTTIGDVKQIDDLAARYYIWTDANQSQRGIQPTSGPQTSDRSLNADGDRALGRLQQEGGVYAQLHSPAHLHAFDDQGRHVGLDGQNRPEVAIPGAYYSGSELQTGRPEVIYVPGNTPIRIAVAGYREGTFGLTVRQRTAEGDRTIGFENVPISNGQAAGLQPTGGKYTELITPKGRFAPTTVSEKPLAASPEGLPDWAYWIGGAVVGGGLVVMGRGLRRGKRPAPPPPGLPAEPGVAATPTTSHPVQPEPEDHAARFCGNCGRTVPEEVHFCGNCGAPISGAAR